jgi:hypothetical protein
MAGPWVRRGNHSSWADVTIRLLQPTRTTDPETDRLTFVRHAVPIRFCSRWGLPCHPCYQRRGGLLPHPFTLTPSFLVSGPETRHNERRGGFLSVALSLGSPPPDVIRHRVSLEPGLSSHAAFRLMTCAAARPAGARINAYLDEKANEKGWIVIQPFPSTANQTPRRVNLTLQSTRARAY